MIIDPWGKIVTELGGCAEEKDGSEGKDSCGRKEKEGQGREDVEEDGEEVYADPVSEGRLAFAEIDLDMVERVRREVPLVRRTDVYPEFV
jgi:predicted amidohydrolase